MNVEAVGEIAAAAAAATAGQASPQAVVANPLLVGATGQASFGGMVSGGLEQINQTLLTSQQDMQNLAIGNVQNLHQVMIRLEESKITFQLMLQMRNRMLESYQDVMRMQV
ncbi:flagellar hook-basal body complex protein FliE [Cupriavidus sp. 30B13]|uniref:flagellar hook-basal body complex protein FliE n=1 Tax=Cupriavidus sp. 30B13 TaxID=3384241 RepID=UPI003B8F0023